MSGIILLLILAVWFYIVKKLSDLCVLKIDIGTKKMVIHKIIFIFIFILPVADEIVGRFQFRALCTPENVLVYDLDKAKGMNVDSKKSINRTIHRIIPIIELTREWFNPDTGEILIIHRMYTAKGGWLSQLIGFPQGNAPYTFTGRCGFMDAYRLFEKLDIKEIEN